MPAVNYLPEEVKKSFAFKLAVYILPGIMFALVSIILLVPSPKPKEGLLQGHVSALAPASSTLVFEPLPITGKTKEIILSPGADYAVRLPVGKYTVRLKDQTLTSPQLPRTLTVLANSSAIFDITIELD